MFLWGSHGLVFYAGTYKFFKGPILSGVPDLAQLKLPRNATETLARHTLESCKSTQHMFDAVEGAYAKGALSLGVIGMQYVGYK